MKKYIKKFLKIIVILFIVIVLVVINIFYKNNNLKFLSLENKNKLMSILEINEAQSFYPIYKKYNGGFHGSDPNYYEIKFEISIEDYEKNNLNYKEESYYDVLIDCRYKEKKDENTYICILRASNLQNRELYDQVAKIK